MNEEETEKLKDLKAVYSGAIQSGEIGIANMIKGGIDLIEKLQKEIESWKSYSEELEEKTTEISNKKCELEFEVERLQKENEELKEELKEENELNKIIKDTKLDELFCRRNGKKVEQAIKLRDELLKLPECKLYGIKKCKKSVVLITKEEVIPVQKIKDKIEELQNNLHTVEHYETIGAIHVLQELLEGRK